MTRLSRTDLETHARHWIAAWNAHDVETVLAPFAEDAVFISLSPSRWRETRRSLGRTPCGSTGPTPWHACPIFISN